MSSTSTSDDEFPIQDDEIVSELVRTPSRASADLQQHVDLEDDLEPVLHVKERGPTKRERLEDLLRRVERIEEHLGIADPGRGPLPTSNPPGAFEGPARRRPSAEHPTVRNPERGKSRSPADLERRAHAQRSGEGETDQPEEPSNPEE
jgi:hypothetical protein